MANTVIAARGISKFYSTWTSPSFRLFHYMLASARAPGNLLRRIEQRHGRRFYALRNVNFEIQQGEAVGIVGPNGSGKSSLLKIIAGVLPASSGSMEVHGKVTALLELGSGFNPEYTGMENIRFYASLLGISSDQLRTYLPKIIDFADIGEFIHRPIKTYSSGMKMRLAFAVTTTLEPEILIVDEALAVGDEAFRRKCYARIDALLERKVTFLFVSHSEGAVLQLCQRAILLNQGELVHDGPTKTTLAHYHALINRKLVGDERAAPREIRPTDTGMYNAGFLPQSTVSYPSEGALIRAAGLYDLQGRRVNQIYHGQAYELRYSVAFNRTCRKVRFSVLFKTETGFPLGGKATAGTLAGIETVRAGTEYNVRFQFVCMFSPGVYFLNAGVKGAFEDREIFLHRIMDLMMFRVLPQGEPSFTSHVDLQIKASARIQSPKAIVESSP